MNSVFDFDGLSLAAESGARGVQPSAPHRYVGWPVRYYSPVGFVWVNGGDRLVSVKLFMCQEIKSLCRGSISNSGDGRFCTRKRSDVKTHKANKVTVKEGHLYI
jgi:hypothetical protein